MEGRKRKRPRVHMLSQTLLSPKFRLSLGIDTKCHHTENMEGDKTFV